MSSIRFISCNKFASAGVKRHSKSDCMRIHAGTVFLREHKRRTVNAKS